MEQRDQGDERDEDATVPPRTTLSAEDYARVGFAAWLRDHDAGCKGGAEDATTCCTCS